MKVSRKRNASDYRLLVLAIIAFYAIMTFDYTALQNGYVIAWVKVTVGGLSALYLLWTNIFTLFIRKEKSS